MALDPKTLKGGDIVIFGGNVERTVLSKSCGYDHLERFINWNDEGGCTYMHEPFWQIAELKKPSLPNVLGGNLFVINSFENYSPIDHANIPPFLLLTMLKRSVKELEAAGVKEA